MSFAWQTAWHGSDLVISQGDQEVDRMHAADIRRVVFVYRDAGETPGDFAYALFELDDECLILPPESGIAGRVHFEHQAFWAEHPLIYWVDERQASLPVRYRPTGWWFRRRASPAFQRVPRGELAGLIEQWPLVGPQTWQQRKWRHIEDSRPLANLPVRAGGEDQPPVRNRA